MQHAPRLCVSANSRRLADLDLHFEMERRPRPFVLSTLMSPPISWVNLRLIASPADDEASDLDLTPEAIGDVEPVSANRALPEQTSTDRVNGYDDVT